MFTNERRQEERIGKYGTPRLQYLQELVNEFQTSTDEEAKVKIAANLANFAYDPYNYSFLRELNVLELFLDCITEEDQRLVEFGIGGVCNASADLQNAKVIAECDGARAAIQCLCSVVRNTVKYALGALYYLCEVKSCREEVLGDEAVMELITKFSKDVSVEFSNLAKAFLAKYEYQQPKR